MSVNMKVSGNLIPIASLTKAIVPIGIASCYSTDEKQIGCWVNGKPVYQKSYILSSNIAITNSGINISSYIDNMSEIEHYINAFVVGTLSGGIRCSSIYVGIESSNLMAYCAEGISANVIILQYTKTADVAGSGQWLPSGEIAHHYSTQEQVIGTYVDGKPLYEKTYVTAFTSGSVSRSISFADANVKIMVDMRGVVENAIPFDIHGVCGTGNTNLRITSNATYGQYGYVDGNGITVTRGSSALYSPTAAIRVTIRYTKSTD